MSNNQPANNNLKHHLPTSNTSKPQFYSYHVGVRTSPQPTG